MKIANKITLLIVFLFCVMAANTWVGLRQMGNIRQEFTSMTNYNMGLMESVSTIHQLQLQKSVLLQQLIGIAEELGFEQVEFARSSYLHDQLKGIRDGLGNYAQISAQETTQARIIAKQARN